MKKLIPFLVFILLLSANNVFSQSPYFFKTTDVLKAEKDAALQSSQYAVSNEITKELTSRNEVQVKIDMLQADINKKLEIEDYVAAQALKDQIEKIKADQAKADDLRKKIEAALAIEDYEKADQYKTALLNLNNPAPAPAAVTQQVQVSQPVSSGFSSGNTNTNNSQAVVNSLSGFASKSQDNTPKTQQKSYNGRSKFFSRRGMSLEAAMAITSLSSSTSYSGITYFVNWRFYRNIANFGDKGGILLHHNLGYLPYAFSTTTYYGENLQYYAHALTYQVGMKIHVVGLSASFGYFIDLFLDGEDINSGFAYRLAYETGRVEFLFEHRLGNSDYYNLNALLIGIGLKMGKRRVVK